MADNKRAYEKGIYIYKNVTLVLQYRFLVYN